MSNKIHNYREVADLLMNKLGEVYWTPLYEYLQSNPDLIKTFPGLIIRPEKVIFYFGKKHIVIEYCGLERLKELKPNFSIEVEIRDFSINDGNILEQIIGFNYDGTSKQSFYLPPYSEDLIMPTNKGFEKLLELNWNFMAQNSILTFNAKNFEIPDDRCSRYVNSFFFDADENGLKTRHIKWLECIPLLFDDTNPEYDSLRFDINYLSNLVEVDANYIYPLPNDNDFKYVKLPQINRFIELISNKTTSETEITRFLEKEENKFILSMVFLAKNIHPQKICEWQSEHKNPIKPDFFIEQANGYGNIVEFKLPNLKGNVITGKHNRETFSAEIQSYISQTRVYKTYFEDPNNRKWFENRYNFKVHNPKRVLVVGRRWDFKQDDWREIINEYPNLEIVTYDDLIDGLTAQFYN